MQDIEQERDSHAAGLTANARVLELDENLASLQVLWLRDGVLLVDL